MTDTIRKSWWTYREGVFLVIQLLLLAGWLSMAGLAYYRGYYAPDEPLYSRECYASGHYVGLMLHLLLAGYSLLLVVGQRRQLQRRARGETTPSRAMILLVLALAPLLIVLMALLTYLSAYL